MPKLRINLTVEVASATALEAILQTGMIRTGLHCTILPRSMQHIDPDTGRVVVTDAVLDDSEIAPDQSEPLLTDDYRNAPGGTGPQAATWKDKPHRLVYDLCREVESLRAQIARLT